MKEDSKCKELVEGSKVEYPKIPPIKAGIPKIQKRKNVSNNTNQEFF